MNNLNDSNSDETALNRRLDMTTLKRICRPRVKMVASLVIIAGMLTACGNKRQRYFDESRYNPYALNGLSQVGDRLPDNVQGQIPPALPSPEEISPSLPSAVGSFSGQEITLDTAEDFGNLFYCYQNILNLGKGYFRQGYTADAIFRGAGEQIAACYQQVINQRMQAYQAQVAYQQYLYQQQDRERLMGLLTLMAPYMGTPVYEPVRPPSLR